MSFQKEGVRTPLRALLLWGQLRSHEELGQIRISFRKSSNFDAIPVQRVSSSNRTKNEREIARSTLDPIGCFEFELLGSKSALSSKSYHLVCQRGKNFAKP